MSHNCLNGLDNCVKHGKPHAATLEAAKQYVDSQRIAWVDDDGIIHQIDPKFIPAVDYLDFNANGTQYRIYVDENGALTTEEAN